MPIPPSGITRLQQLKYRNWRRRIPYTDAQIDAALTMCSTRVRRVRWVHAVQARFRATGYISAYALRYAVVPYLMQVCAICGATAHYHWGLWGAGGRCPAHKGELTPTLVHNLRRKDRQFAARLRSVAEYEQRLDAALERQHRSATVKRGMR